MSIENKITALVEQKLATNHIYVINESNKHIGHAGDDGSGQTHFKLKIVSESFENLNKLQRHRLVNDIVKPLFSEGLHALSLELFTLKEWQKNK